MAMSPTSAAQSPFYHATASSGTQPPPSGHGGGGGSGRGRPRHDAYPADLQLRPGCHPITTDVCVPISRLADCIRETRKDIEQVSMPVPLLGHVGDGNFHLLLLPDPGSESELKEAELINQRLVRRALEMDGTCSGEHGVGMGKIGFLEEENPGGVEVMKQLKRALDPHNILNPGKVLNL